MSRQGRDRRQPTAARFIGLPLFAMVLVLFSAGALPGSGVSPDARFITQLDPLVAALPGDKTRSTPSDEAHYGSSGPDHDTADWLAAGCPGTGALRPRPPFSPAESRTDLSPLRRFLLPLAQAPPGVILG